MKLKKTKLTKKIISPGILKKHYSPGIPVKINQTKYDGKVHIYILVVNLK